MSFGVSGRSSGRLSSCLHPLSFWTIGERFSSALLRDSCFCSLHYIREQTRWSDERRERKKPLYSYSFRTVALYSKVTHTECLKICRLLSRYLSLFLLLPSGQRRSLFCRSQRDAGFGLCASPAQFYKPGEHQSSAADRSPSDLSPEAACGGAGRGYSR